MTLQQILRMSCSGFGKSSENYQGDEEEMVTGQTRWFIPRSVGGSSTMEFL